MTINITNIIQHKQIILNAQDDLEFDRDKEECYWVHSSFDITLTDDELDLVSDDELRSLLGEYWWGSCEVGESAYFTGCWN